MAIRFQCTACSQPIEVDDEWASKPVMCPYCRKTVTAPAESQLELDQVHLATPLSSKAPSTGTSTVPAFRTPEPRRNRCAVAALVLAGVMIVQLIAMSRIISVHEDFFRDLGMKVQTAVDEGADPLAAYQRVWREQLDQMGGRAPKWMERLSLLAAGILLTWIATVVFGIVGVLRPYRRQWAVLSLVLCGVTPVMFCCGGL